MFHLSPPPKHGSGGKGPVTGILGSVSAAVVLFAKRVSRASRRPRAAATEPKAPRLRSKLSLNLTSRSRKTAPLSHRKKEEEEEEEAEKGYGDGGVWQKGILMGDRCEPLEFSGVIYYDCNGKQLAELPPRSPRASPFPSYARRF